MVAPLMTFESWVAADRKQRQLKPNPGRTPCTCCGKKRKRLTEEEYCFACLRYMYGYDEAQAHVIEALVGGLVYAALKGELSELDVAAAVQRAIARDHGDECQAIVNSLRRPRAVAS